MYHSFLLPKEGYVVQVPYGPGNGLGSSPPERRRGISDLVYRRRGRGSCGKLSHALKPQGLTPQQNIHRISTAATGGTVDKKTSTALHRGTHKNVEVLYMIQGLASLGPFVQRLRPWERIFPTPFLLSCQKKQWEKPSWLFGARFRLTASFFLSDQKETKESPGVGRGRTSSAKGALSF